MRRAVSLIAWGALLAVCAPSLAHADAKADCAGRLKTLGRMCLLYARQNDGKLPPSLQELYYQAYVNDFDMFVCPGNPAEIEAREDINDKSGYVLSPKAEGTEPRAILQDRSPANHAGEGINVFYSDDTVRWQPAEGAGPEAPDQGKPAHPQAETEPVPLGVTIVPGSPITKVTLCLGVDRENKPIQPGTRFPATANKIACLVAYKDVPTNSELFITWFRGSKRLARALSMVEGSGRLIAYAYTPAGEPFKAGPHHVVITVGDRKAATANFVVE